jgi:hypothetical protein
MEELRVTQYWMLGVVATMAVFAIVALIGYLRRGRGRVNHHDNQVP